jgi:hypothetical protein
MPRSGWCPTATLPSSPADAPPTNRHRSKRSAGVVFTRTRERESLQIHPGAPCLLAAAFFGTSTANNRTETYQPRQQLAQEPIRYVVISHVDMLYIKRN